MRDVRITTIYEGTTGIQANDLVGRKLLRDNGHAVGRLLEDVAAFVAELAVAAPPLATTAHGLADALAAARAAVAHVLDGHADDPQLAGSAAVNLLMLLGTLLGGWRLACGALAAHEALRAGTTDEPFLQAKVITSEFFAEHFLPRAVAYGVAVRAGSRTVTGLKAEQFAR
jgi:hypothetical protein